MIKDTRCVRFGVIGCGLMGREFASASMRWLHLKQDLPRPVIIAACDVNEDNLDYFRRVPETRYFYHDYREMLNNPEIEAVYCAVPHRMHAEVYSAVIRSGRHLLGEKPFGIDLAAFEQVEKEINAHPEVLVRCTSEFPYYPAVQKMVSLYREGKLGQLIGARFAIQHSSDMDPQKPINWKRITSENGEYGCMGDLGIHTQHLPFRLGIRPVSVSAVLSDIIHTRPDQDGNPVPCGTWDNAVLLCEGTNDAGDRFPVQFDMKRMAPGCGNTVEYELYGLKMSLRFTTEDPNHLHYTVDHGKNQAWARLPVGQTTLYPVITGGIFEFGFSDALLQMYAAYMCELTGRDCPFGCFTPEEAKKSHQLLTAALEAYREKKVVLL